MSARAVDAQTLFGRAEKAFSLGRDTEARKDLRAITGAAGRHPAVLHLLALVEKRLGNRPASIAAFNGALRAAPADPQINNNLANLLDADGDTSGALASYGRAIEAAPRFVDARFNRALLLQRLGRPVEALADLDAAATASPPSAQLLTGRGGVLHDLDRLDEAAVAFDAALMLDPARPTALASRARIALERGEPDAVDRYAQALARHPDDDQLRLGHALALEAIGAPGADQGLAVIVARKPSWVEGHEQLVRMRAEAGDAEDPTRSFHDALAQEPDDLALHLAHWTTLIRAERFAEALAGIDATGITMRDHQDVLMVEALAASEAGMPDRAEAVLDRLKGVPGAELTLARHQLRRNRPREAAATLEPVVAHAPGDIHAWSLLSLAWRLTGDPRHHWLCEQPGLVGAIDLPFEAGELDALAALLVSLHRTRAHPIGQSLRGGTQTRGRLLARTEPLLARLRTRLEEGVARHVAGLPAFDAGHPLLRHRDRPFALAGSWSVRLEASGFHVNHVHSQGLLSSAFYVALPPSIGTDESRAGWLALGAPPVALGLDLPALALVEPRRGRLALFPSYLFHGTRPFASGERLTVAFDVLTR